jgi:hypothetical protein
MSTPDRPTSLKFDAADEEVVRYRAVSSLAVAGLVAGLLSPLAMFSAVLWLLPLAAVVLSGLALRRLAVRGPELVGRPAALAGLLLGVTFLVAPPAEDLVYRRYLRQQARQFAQAWIDAVRDGSVYKAHHYMIDPLHRPHEEKDLVNFYRNNPTWQRTLRDFVKQPTMRTLFALGPEAEIRYYATDDEGSQGPFDLVRQTYAVTYEDEQKRPTSFFITLAMKRSIEAGSGRACWTLARVEGGVRPAGW